MRLPHSEQRKLRGRTKQVKTKSYSNYGYSAQSFSFDPGATYNPCYRRYSNARSSSFAVLTDEDHGVGMTLYLYFLHEKA